MRIVNNKKVDLTDQEWKYFQDICRSYDRPGFKGEELFVDLFESNDTGIISFIKSPNTRFTSLEAYLFICSIFHHQQARLWQSEVDALVKKYETKLSELNIQIENKLNDR